MNYDPLTLANAFIQAGELDDALDALNHHLEANPEEEDVRRLRVQVLMRMEREDQWRAALSDLSLLQNPKPDDYLQKSIIYERMGDLERAVEAVISLISMADVYTERWIHLLAMQGKFGQASMAALTRPKTWRWCEVAADMFAASGSFTAAVQHYTEALQLIEQEYLGVLSEFLNAAKARILLARANAIRHYDQLREILSQNEPYAMHLDAFVPSTEIELAQADADYAAAEQIIPNDPMIPFNRGLIALLMGDSERGIALCRSAYTNAPTALRDEMQKAMAEDERYAPIAAALEA